MKSQVSEGSRYIESTHRVSFARVIERRPQQLVTINSISRLFGFNLPNKFEFPVHVHDARFMMSNDVERSDLIDTYVGS